ncbi:GAF domain-containing sensor histidine kinase [Algoriphagus jejuensis]|uniref:histidine kinase n=1 Tax=Algoriphagus jejuensis TaxID=419934 RepID=A0ABN1N6D5_9BACT
MDKEGISQKQAIDMMSPIPANEMQRLLALNELELDYSDLDKSFADLTRLAAKIAGTSISMINLIDTYTQWSIAPYGVDIKNTPRENSICQYTILEGNAEGMEVADLSLDDRFKKLSYVTEAPFLKYYFGLPLKIKDDLSIGSLCVLHDDYTRLSKEKKEMLEIIAGEIVSRIKIGYELNTLGRKVQECTSIKNNVVHDIRGPIWGIVGLAEIIQLQGNENSLEEILNYIDLIQKSGKSVLDLVDEILSQSTEPEQPTSHEFTLVTLKAKLLDLFGPQAIIKNVELTFEVGEQDAEAAFPKASILQIMGNLISNSIKFTPDGGRVTVRLDLVISERQRTLRFRVKDNGVGMAAEKITQILGNKGSSSAGTSGEKGFGFGLRLVQQLVANLHGHLLINSQPGQGVEIELNLPLS